MEAPGASKTLCGVKDGWQERIEARIREGTIHRQLTAQHLTIPEEFDSETNWPQCAKIIGEIRDQSNCGCCWAFAGAEAASDRMCIATNASMKISLSAQDVCFNGGPHVGSLLGGCSGGNSYFPW